MMTRRNLWRKGFFQLTEGLSCILVCGDGGRSIRWMVIRYLVPATISWNQKLKHMSLQGTFHVQTTTEADERALMP